MNGVPQIWSRVYPPDPGESSPDPILTGKILHRSKQFLKGPGFGVVYEDIFSVRVSPEKWVDPRLALGFYQLFSGQCTTWVSLDFWVFVY